MSVVKIVELSASSPDSFEHAIRNGIRRACETLNNVRGAWVAQQKVVVEGDEIAEYRVDMKVSFELD